ncbi:MAG: APC family permease [Anaerolineaceae bacterium]|nr:APC family permease [Anaerolineaceae bacterium]
MNKGKSKVKSLGIFALAMINVAAVLSLRNYPSMAEYGWSSIGWYIIGTITFLIPLTLASAELATGWPKGGGVFAWVKEAFGDTSGFIAVFCEWSNNLVWFPTVLAFIASTFAFVLNPSLANNGLYMFVVMMVVFWGTTLIALLGSKASSRFQSFGVVAGTIIPGVLIIGLGVWYMLSGKPIQLPPFTFGAIIPTINLSTLPFISTIVLMFAGMEMAGFHALEVRNPQTDYPKGMLLSAVIIFILTVIGTLAISIVIPLKNLNLAAGLLQAFQDFLKAFNLSWLLAPLAILIVLGGIALLESWLIGPALGLGVVAKEGNMPPMFSQHNKHGSPTAVLILQAVIGTLISLLYVFIPSVSSSYWIMSALTVLLLCIAYLFVFAAVIKLRYTQPNVHRSFKIPGGIVGVWIVGGVGFLATAFSFLVSLLPTPGMGFSTLSYAALMLVGTAVLALPPLVFIKLKKASWKIKTPSTKTPPAAPKKPLPVAR